MTLEEIEKSFDSKSMFLHPELVSQLKWLTSRVKELEEGIRKHRRTIGEHTLADEDEELYKLLREG